MDKTTRSPLSDRTDERRALVLLATLSLLYLTFLFLYVPRLNNYVHSDREFTGWVGPIAERFFRGQRPYTDFVLPIPPGSFVLLALIQRAAGRGLLLQELWVEASCEWLMGLIAYAIARQFSTRKVGLLVAMTTLVLVSQSPKECAYDQTSLLVAWLDILVGARALLSPENARRTRLWFLAGVLATFSLVFKQSTATGLIAGWGLAFAYLVGIEAWRARPQGVRRRLSDATWCAAGGVLGLVLVALVVLSVHASLGAFVQAVLLDGPALKGGTFALVRNLFNFTVRNDAIRNTIAPATIVLVIGFGIARRHGSLHVGDDGEPRVSLGRGSVGLLLAAMTLTFGSAIALLAANVRALQHVFSAVVDTLRNVPAYGFVFAIAFFAAHVIERHAATEESRARGHALNAILLSAVTCSMIYDTSFILFSPFYYNEPSIPVALLCLFIATERSGLVWATPLALGLSMLPTFGVKLNRALSADTRVDSGQWSGLRVNYRGLEILRAASRARELSGPDGSVLVLPEDVELAGLIHRPRPPVKGAVLFVDQYPKRLLKADIATLDAHLPDVIVIHPRRPDQWQTVYHTWSHDSAAEQMLNHVLGKLLPRYYRLDSSYPTIYFWDEGEIDVYARKDAAHS